MRSYAEWLRFEQARVDEARADLRLASVIDHDELFDQLEREYGNEADLDKER